MLIRGRAYSSGEPGSSSSDARSPMQGDASLWAKCSGLRVACIESFRKPNGLRSAGARIAARCGRSLDARTATVQSMEERVVPLEIGVTWEPNAPDAVLVCDDRGSTSLALEAHPDDPDQRNVVLVWTGTESAALMPPNDEARSGHRLYGNGLSGLLWAGVVQDSELVAKDLRRCAPGWARSLRVAQHR